MKLEIDSSLCIGCGACVRDCPMMVLTLDENRRPVVSHEKDNSCIACQHCMAICPRGALAIDGVSASEGKGRAELDLPSAAQMDDLFLQRRSIRQYRSEDVPEELIAQLLSTLSNVPTGCNAMGLTFTVVRNGAEMAKLRDRTIDTLAKTQMDHMLPRFIAKPAILYRRTKHDEFFRNAPHLLIVSASAARSTTPYEDCIAAISYFSMLAEAHGLGTTWCGYLKFITNLVPAVKDVFGIPREDPYYAMLFGYPAIKYPRTVNRSKAMEIRYLG